MSEVQDALLARLIAGDFGPWGGQSFVGTDAISILRPDTMQWETIRAVAGDADLTEATLGHEVGMGSTLEWASEDDMDASGYGTGNQTVTGITPTAGPGMGGIGHPSTAVVSALTYADADFVRTELGMVRQTEGLSNGVSGPISPIRFGEKRNVVDRDGNPWFPQVRFDGVDEERSGTSTGRLM